MVVPSIRRQQPQHKYSRRAQIVILGFVPAIHLSRRRDGRTAEGFRGAPDGDVIQCTR